MMSNNWNIKLWRISVRLKKSFKFSTFKRNFVKLQTAFIESSMKFVHNYLRTEMSALNGNRYPSVSFLSTSTYCFGVGVWKLLSIH